MATETRATPVAAYDGTVVWSSYRAAERRYVLMLRHDGRTRRLPVAPRRVPFDASVGPSPGGRPLVAFSRCRSEPDAGGLPVLLPAYPTARGCRLWGIEPGAAGPRPLVGWSRRTSWVLPVVWRGRVAAVGVTNGRPALYLGKASGAPRRVLRRPRAAGARELSRPGPTGIALRGTRIAYAWPHRGCGSSTDRIPALAVELGTVAPGSRARVRYSSCEGEVVFSPSLSRGVLSFARTSSETGRRVGELRRQRLDSGASAKLAVDPDVVSYGQDGTTAYTSEGDRRAKVRRRAWPASARAAAHGCLPRNATIEAANGQVVAYRTQRGHFACRGKVRRRLADLTSDGSADSYMVAVAGRFVVSERTTCPRDAVGDCIGALRIRDMRRGGGPRIAIPPRHQWLVGLVAFRDGSAAWMRRTDVPGRYEVRAFDGSGERVLAAGTDLEPYSIAAAGRWAYWTQGGAPRSARVGFTPN